MIKNLLTVISLICPLLLFAGCTQGDELSGEMYVVVADASATEVKSFTVGLDGYTTKNSVGDLIIALGVSDEGFYLSGGNSEYGYYVNEVGYTDGGVTHKLAVTDYAKNQFVAVYTDINDCFDATYGSVTYGAKTLYSASYGVSLLPLQDGATVYFTQGTY
ncbi:MAG: hypothetical protein K2N47_03960 [Clostridia bacterium]|nr:hypothetical protein [Clostridia bacterium]